MPPRQTTYSLNKQQIIQDDSGDDMPDLASADDDTDASDSETRAPRRGAGTQQPQQQRGAGGSARQPAGRGAAGGRPAAGVAAGDTTDDDSLPGLIGGCTPLAGWPASPFAAPRMLHSAPASCMLLAAPTPACCILARHRTAYCLVHMAARPQSSVLCTPPHSLATGCCSAGCRGT